MATIEAGPNGSMVAAAGAIGVAVDQDILVVNGQAHHSAHAVIPGVLGSVRKHFTIRQLLPGRAAVLAASNANTGTVSGRQRRAVHGHGDILKQLAVKQLLYLEGWFLHEHVDLVFYGMSLSRQPFAAQK